MKNFVRILLITVFLLIVLFVAFYFWAQQETHDQKLRTIDYPKNQQEKSDSTLNVFTYNIGYLSGMDNNTAVRTPDSMYFKNLQTVIRELSKLQPDIAAFQEIDFGCKRSYNTDQHHEIGSRLFGYSVQAINWDKRYVPFPYWPPTVNFGRMLSGQSTMSQWPLLQPERMVLTEVKSNPFYYNAFYLDRLAVETLVKHPLKEFWLINVHTEAFDQVTRTEQINNLHQLFKGKQKEHPVIMLGDFNSSPNYDQPAINTFLNDTTIGCVAYYPGEYQNSFTSKLPLERLDYIFYSKTDFEEISGEVLSSFGTASDHLPVYGKLKIKP